MITKASIKELTGFFKGRKLPDIHIKLGNSETIIHTEKMVNSHLAILPSHIGNEYFTSYQDRLYKLKTILENEEV